MKCYFSSYLFKAAISIKLLLDNDKLFKSCSIKANAYIFETQFFLIKNHRKPNLPINYQHYTRIEILSSFKNRYLKLNKANIKVRKQWKWCLYFRNFTTLESGHRSCGQT